MEMLTTIGQRLQNTRSKYDHIKQSTIHALNNFLQIQIPPNLQNTTNYRIQQLKMYLDQLPQNQAIKQHLFQMGYHPQLWDKDLHLIVQIDDKRNVYENYRRSLIGSFQEYVDILKTLGIKTIQVENQQKEIDSLFPSQDPITFEKLEIRKQAAIETIKKSIKSHHRRTFYKNRIQSLKEKVKKKNKNKNIDFKFLRKRN